MYAKTFLIDACLSFCKTKSGLYFQCNSWTDKLINCFGIESQDITSSQFSSGVWGLNREKCHLTCGLPQLYPQNQIIAKLLFGLLFLTYGLLQLLCVLRLTWVESDRVRSSGESGLLYSRLFMQLRPDCSRSAWLTSASRSTGNLIPAAETAERQRRVRATLRLGHSCFHCCWWETVEQAHTCGWCMYERLDLN